MQGAESDCYRNSPKITFSAPCQEHSPGSASTTRLARPRSRCVNEKERGTAAAWRRWSGVLSRPGAKAGRRLACRGKTRKTMKFGIFYELIALRPHDNAAVIRSYKEALQQIIFAEEMGFEYVWETEHHFLEKFSYSSAPELFLTAVAQKTSRIRIGHGAVLLTMNHPVRVAERAAVLDILSDGRLEFGTARGVTEAEL